MPGASIQGGKGRASSALRQIFNNISDLRFLISALLIVSGVFPQRCALIVPSLTPFPTTMTT
jgi:hypothetical protein